MSNYTIVKFAQKMGLEEADALLFAKEVEGAQLDKLATKEDISALKVQLAEQGANLTNLKESVKGLDTKITGLYITVIGAVVVLLLTKYLPFLPH